jgi:hypothetical protein
MDRLADIHRVGAHLNGRAAGDGPGEQSLLANNWSDSARTRM